MSNAEPGHKVQGWLARLGRKLCARELAGMAVGVCVVVIPLAIRGRWGLPMDLHVRERESTRMAITLSHRLSLSGDSAIHSRISMERDRPSPPISFPFYPNTTHRAWRSVALLRGAAWRSAQGVEGGSLLGSHGPVSGIYLPAGLSWPRLAPCFHSPGLARHHKLFRH